MQPSRNFRILHVLDHSLPLHSGYAFRTHNILKTQVNRGWKPVALTSQKHKMNDKDFGKEFEQFDTIRYYRTPQTSYKLPRGIYELALMKATLSRIQQLCLASKPDILHAHSPVLNAIPALIVSRRLHVPLVYEIRAFWEDAAVDHRTYAQGCWKYKLVRSLETWICRRADHIFVLCEGIKGDLKARGIPSDKMTVVGNGIDTSQFASSEPDPCYRQQWGLEGKTTIGFIGSFYHYEGIDLLVTVFARLASRRPDLMLLLAGGGEMETALQEQVTGLGLEGRVVFTGRVPNQVIPKIYDLVDVLVYPRYSMRLTELVTPLKPLEAMAMKKAILAADIGGHRELICDGTTGVLFSAGQSDSLASKLEFLLENPALSAQLAENAQSWVHSERSWAKMTEAHCALYDHLIKSSSQSEIAGRASTMVHPQ